MLLVELVLGVKLWANANFAMVQGRIGFGQCRHRQPKTQALPGKIAVKRQLKNTRMPEFVRFDNHGRIRLQITADFHAQTGCAMQPYLIDDRRMSPYFAQYCIHPPGQNLIKSSQNCY